jgi:hypothetical protein
MKKVIGFVLCVVLASMPLMSYAFKIDTHIWVGQQVINDLETNNGRISLDFNNQKIYIDVPANVKNAILSNKSAFLMGNIGPDAVPDVIVGQMFPHPGAEVQVGVDEKNIKVYANIGWRTKDWLQYLLRESINDPVGKAFTYGYLGHAAADVMAHTYINQYAGDIFRIADNETLVEQRHFILENFIGTLTPPLLDKSGNYLGKPWQVINLESGYAQFARDKLIYNVEVQQEYKKTKEFAAHLIAYVAIKDKLDSEIANPEWDKMSQNATRRIAAFTGFNISTSQAESINNEINNALKSNNANIDRVQAGAKKFHDKVIAVDRAVFTKLTNANIEMQNREAEWVTKHAAWRTKALESALKPLCTGGDWKCPPLADTLFGCALPKVFVPFSGPACDLAKRLDSEAKALEQDALASKNDFVNSHLKAHAELTNAIDAAQKIQDDIIDFQQRFTGNINPVISYLKSWRADIDTAMTAYVKATSQSMINTMNPDVSALDPIIDWVKCYHRGMLGAGDDILGCEFIANVQKLTESVEMAIALQQQAFQVGDSATVNGTTIPQSADILQAKKDLITKLEDELKEAIKKEILSFVPLEIQSLMAISKRGVTDSELNSYFSITEFENRTKNLIGFDTSTADKGLLMIPDMAARVKAEMHLKNGKFDPDQYAVAYNAVVLAKLALLGASGFDQLISAAGLDVNQYRGYFSSGNNLVADPFASIDGNHQWMPVPPPYPNNFNTYKEVNYTYSAEVCGNSLDPRCVNNKTQGFVLWKGDMRDKLFRKLFKGPLSLGVDAPSIPAVTGQRTFVSQSNPYQSCSARPFPSDISDRTCLVVWLIPVLSGLLLN